MLKAIGLCILLFTIFRCVRTMINSQSRKVNILSEIISLFRSTLGGVKNFMKPIGEEIARISSPVLNKCGIREAILTRDVGYINKCDTLTDSTRELLGEYIMSYGGIDYDAELLRLEALIEGLNREYEVIRSDLCKKKKLYTTLGASLSFALIIFVI